MKIVVIRHAKVNMKWERRYNSVGFDEACKKYDNSPIDTIDKKYNVEGNSIIYISGLSRTRETALKLFGKKKFYKSELLNEVPIRSYKDTNKKIPLAIWNVMGRVQWFLDNARQIETRAQTRKRAEKAASMIEKNNKDCYIVTHGMFMRTFLHELEKRGFTINKRRIIVDNLEEFILNRQY